MKRKYLNALVAAAAFAALGTAQAQKLTVPQAPSVVPQTPGALPETPSGITPPAVGQVTAPRAGADARASGNASVGVGKKDAKANTSARGQADAHSPNRARAGTESNASSGANRASAGAQTETGKR